MKTSLKSLIVVSSAALALLSTGCQMGKIELTGEDPVTIPAATSSSGLVMGGQQPIGNMALQLYAVGATGYGSASTAIAGATATTTDNGNFTMGTYTCPTSSTLVYLVGTGGNPIAAVAGSNPTPAVANANITMMVGLGACSTAFSGFVNMNEVTTVATIWSLSPFMVDLTHIGTSATNAIGIANAFATINNLVNVNTVAGTATPTTPPTYTPGPNLPAGATIPTAEINTLADIMEQCVNSSGLASGEPITPTASTTGCNNLFEYAQTATVPNDTATAMMNIAQHPTKNVSALNQLRSGSPVFTPALDVNYPPSDWTIAITYTNGGLSTPQGVAIDQVGNVWVANSGGNRVSKFSPPGAAISSSTGYTAGSITAPYALAVDPAGNVWVANTASVTKLYGYTGSAATATGATATTGATGTSIINVASSTAAPISSPRSIATDGAGNVFVPNTGANSVALINNFGSPIYGSPITTSVSAPAGVALSPK